jgi:hypothetical protein
MGHVHRRWVGVDHDSDLLGALLMGHHRLGLSEYAGECPPWAAWALDLRYGPPLRRSVLPEASLVPSSPPDRCSHDGKT